MTTAAVARPAGGVADQESARAWSASEVLVAIILAGSLGLALVQPWEPIPFPVFDFGGWFVLLSSAGSAADGFRELVVEFAREGRVNPISVAYVALNWGLFEARPVGWQLLRATIMLAVIGTAYVLFRTLGARRGAALVGAAFFVVTDSARSAWILPQAIEHVATLLVLLAALWAAQYQSAARARRIAVAIAALLVLAIWVREPMVSAVPFVLLLALAHHGQGRLMRPQLDRRSVTLVSIVGTAVALLNVIPVIAVRFLERSEGYASRFGPENISFGNSGNVLSALMLPVTREPLFPANALFVLAIVVAGIGAGVAARGYRCMVLLAATLPLCAAAIYIMWPSFPGNYGLPYVPAIGLVFALALGVLWEGAAIRRALAVAAASAVIGYGTLLGVNGRREYVGSRLLDMGVATFVSARPSSQLIVAVEDPRVSGDLGRAVAMYATATRGQGPVQASDVACSEAERRVAGLPSAVLLLRPPQSCTNASLGTPTTSLTRSTVVRDWKTLRAQRWETTAAFWDGAGAR